MNNNKKIIILLGPPGSGKGTQAKLLTKKYKLEYLGSGDMLRERKKEDDFTGRKTSECIDAGKRVNSPVIFKLWMDKFEEFKERESEINGFVIDGSPRTLMEAKMLELALDWYNWNESTTILWINISEEESINRLVNRKICKNCGNIISTVDKEEKVEKCNKCGGELISRKDDTPEGVKERLNWFKTDVMPAINYYQKKGELYKINGEQSIEKVNQDIVEVIENEN